MKPLTIPLVLAAALSLPAIADEVDLQFVDAAFQCALLADASTPVTPGHDMAKPLAEAAWARAVEAETEIVSFLGDQPTSAIAQFMVDRGPEFFAALDYARAQQKVSEQLPAGNDIMRGAVAARLFDERNCAFLID